MTRPLVAISVGNAEEQLELGFGEEHLAEALVRAARLLLRAGCDLAYGGDLRPQGFTQLLLALVRAEGADRAVGAKVPKGAELRRLVNFLPWPAHRELTADHKARDLGVCRFVRVDPPPPLLPEQCPAIRFPFRWSDVSYADAIEVRAASGEHGSGAMAAWLRPLVPLVEGESTSPLQRLLCVADAANGVSAPLPYDAYTFVNPDLTVALCRPPEGDWILIDARTSVDPGGIGLVDARLADARGYVGRALQTLVVRPRSAAEQAPARG